MPSPGTTGPSFGPFGPSVGNICEGVDPEQATTRAKTKRRISTDRRTTLQAPPS
jgi:hypothetical protein